MTPEEKIELIEEYVSEFPESINHITRHISKVSHKFMNRPTNRDEFGAMIERVILPGIGEVIMKTLSVSLMTTVSTAMGIPSSGKLSDDFNEKLKENCFQTAKSMINHFAETLRPDMFDFNQSGFSYQAVKFDHGDDEFANAPEL